MTREQLAARLHWSRIVWLVGILNPFMMAPQLYKLWTTGVSAGISLETLAILFVIQGAFALHGYFIRDRLVGISNGAAASMTAITALSVLYFNYR